MITITRVCPFTGAIHHRDMDIDQSQYDAWEMGMLIQEAMPHLSPEDREYIMTGITPEAWDEYLGEDC